MIYTNSNGDCLWHSELYHHGIKGQKWGDRRYQYEDGSLTPEGKARYGVGDGAKQSIKNTAKKEIKNFMIKSAEGYGKSLTGRKRLSTGKIVAKMIIRDVLITAGTRSLAMNARTDAGRKAVQAMGFVSSTMNTAVGMTAAIQRGRGRLYK